VLIDFLENEAKLYPVTYEGDRHSDFLVCVQPKGTADIHLWEIRGSVIVSAKDYALVGINEGIYKQQIRHLYLEKPTKLQAIWMGIHLLSFASETSNFVGGEMVVISVNEHGMKTESADQVQAWRERVASVNKALSELLLKVAIHTVSDDEIKTATKSFEQEILGLRKEVKHYVLAAATGRFNLIINPVHASASTEPKNDS
jgi:hypothetical protein